MGNPDQVNEGTALSTLLRQWWQSEPAVRKQDALVAQLKLRGIELTQATLSRYLDPSKPQIAREDVVRELHAIFGRPPEELPVALDLWERATRERTAQQRLRATAAPQDPEPSESAPAPEAGAGAESPSGRSRRGPAYAAVVVLALVVAGALWFALPWEGDGDRGQGPATAEGPQGVSRATGAAAPPTGTGHPTADLASCEGESCFGLEPNHTVCRTDAVTAFVDTDPVIGIELRYSATCGAAWAKISNTTQGDIVRIGDRAGRTREYTQISGRDAHTTMLPATRPEDVTACAVLATRSVCATIPTEPRG
ncbi:DUF2690 domain-containing protein [Streptomyces hydrogenans]|uniref:DUF2690 domain-containing protein n=1 Tax=Streptomyces hydrogenans TaxID=1873719 RepID=UPI003810D1A0